MTTFGLIHFYVQEPVNYYVVQWVELSTLGPKDGNLRFGTYLVRCQKTEMYVFISNFPPLSTSVCHCLYRVEIPRETIDAF
jgi:hypothetical protein